MDQEQKEMATVGGIAFLLCCCLFVVCFSGGSKKSSTENNPKLKDSYKVAAKVEKKSSKGGIRRTGGSSYSSSSSAGYSGGSSEYSLNNVESAVKISKSEYDKLLEFKERALKEQKEWEKEHLRKLIENPNTHPRMKFKARLLENKVYVAAYKAHLNEDFETAINGYLTIINDKNSSPELKYIVAEYLLDCSQLTGNLELFLQIDKLKGELIATKNLSLLGVEKNDKYLKASNEFADYMKARSDLAFKDKFITEFAKKTYRTRSDAERIFNKKLAMYEDLYKDLLRL